VITPYSEVYGIHPRFFDFDQSGGMQLTDKGVAEELRLRNCQDLLGALGQAQS